MPATRRIFVDFDAGTASFITNTDAAGQAMNRFGQSGNVAGTGISNSMIKASAAVQLFEGRLSIRAVERFMTEVLKLGPALTLAFPVIGAALFGTIVVEGIEKLVKMRKEVESLPEKIRGSFRDSTDAIRTTNDQLALTNDRLSNEIAKLEGKPQNNLAIELDEARLAADKLADALDKDFKGLNKLLKENTIGFTEGLKGLLTTGKFTMGTGDFSKMIGGATGTGAFTGEVNQMVADFRDKMEAAPDVKTANSVRDTARAVIQEKLLQIRDAIEDGTKDVTGLTANKALQANPPAAIVSLGPAGLAKFTADYQARIEVEEESLRRLQDMRREVQLMFKNEELEPQKAGLEVGEENRKAQEKKVKESYDEMFATMEQGGKLLASQKIDFREWEIANLESYGSRFKELIAELKKGLGGLYQEGASELQSAQDKDKKEQEEFIKRMTTGGGLVPTGFLQTLGRGTTEAIEASHRNMEANIKAAEDSQKFLTEMFDHPLEPRPEIKQAPIIGDKDLRTRLEQMAKQGYTSDQLLLTQQKLKDLHYETVTVMETEIKQYQDALSMMQTGAYTEGQRLEQQKKIVELQKQLRDLQSGRNAQDELLKATVQERLELGTLRDGWDAFWISMNEQAEKPGKILFDGMTQAVDKISADLAKLTTDPKHANAAKLFGDTFKSIGEKMVEDSTKSVITKGLGALGQAMGIHIPGLGAAKGPLGTPQDPIYVVPMGGVQQRGGPWEKVIGQDTADVLRMGGVDMSKIPNPKGPSEIGKILQKVLGGGSPSSGGPAGWGSIFGGPAGGMVFNLDGNGPGAVVPASVQNLPGLITPNEGEGEWGHMTGSRVGGGQSKSIWGQILGALGSLVGSSGGFGGFSNSDWGGGESVSSSISYGGAEAEGGPVSAGSAYAINESGASEFFIPSTSGTVVPADAMSGGETHYHTYNVDARGADAGSEQRMRRALEETHRASVATSIQANNERNKRVPPSQR